MDDLIRRQDAIDAVEFGITYAKAINKSTGEVKELFKEGNKALNEAVERLKELPSAEPKTPSNGSITSINPENTHDRTMGDLISRHAAIDALNEYFARIGKLKKRGLTKGEKAISLDTVGVIKTLQFVEPKRKTGKWIPDTYGNILCSECGWCAPQIMTGCLANRHLDYEKSNFCWHCGAYMREGETE